MRRLLASAFVALAACSQGVSDTLDPPTGAALVQLTTIAPASPANENAPKVRGITKPRASVEIFADVCTGTPIGTGTAGADGLFEIAIAVADDTTTAVHARATLVNGTQTPCAGGITYVEDSTPPAVPIFVGVAPGPSGTADSAAFSGTCEAGTTVGLFTDDACTNQVATGSAAEFTAGLSVSVAEGATVTVHARATDAAGNASACSTTSLSYTHEKGGPDPTAWRGPTSRIEQIPWTNEVFLNIDGQRFRPVFVSVNPQAITAPEGWQTLLDEIDLARASGMPVIDLMLGNRSVTWLTELAQHLGGRQVYLWLRFDLWIPELANVGVPLMKALDGTETPGLKQGYALGHDAHWTQIPIYSSLDEQWLEVEKASLTTLLADLRDSGFGDRVIGVRPTYMAGGEWFQPPLAFHDGTFDENPPNEWPWSNPEAFVLGDYSAGEKGAFENWLISSGFDGNLPFPEPADRIQPRLGRTFSVGEDGANLSSALYRRFQAERVVRYQAELAKVAKDFTSRKALVQVNNAYLVSLSYYNGSLHTAVAKLLESPDIDAINAPYNYDTEGSRRPGFALVSHGPMDSPALHGKLWIHEDDSRPYWSTDGFRTTTNAAEDESLLVRNAATTLIHGNGLYYFDLPNQGWFGGVPAHAAETRAVYDEVRALGSKVGGKLSKFGPIQPQIAVFVDDRSFHLYPEFGMDGAASYGTSNDLLLRMIEKISQAGAPVRYYLLDDLTRPELDVNPLKLVFFLNTPELTQAQRQAIRSRLMRDGRVLYFQHVPGMFDESMRPSWTLAAEFAPGMSSLGQVEASTSTAVTLSDKGTHVIAYSPRGADAAGVSSLLTRANVLRYATNAVVDGQGQVLMVHGTSGDVALKLPMEARVTDLLTDAVLCAGCRTLTVPLSGPKTRVLGVQPSGIRRLFRYEAAPQSFGGGITTDDATWCSLPDGAALAACGFTFDDYTNAPIIPYGQLTLTHTGTCNCP